MFQLCPQSLFNTTCDMNIVYLLPATKYSEYFGNYMLFFNSVEKTWNQSFHSFFIIFPICTSF